MGRDVRAALPNSVRWRRNGSIVVIEMLNAVEGVTLSQYRFDSGGGRVGFCKSDGSFTTLSSVENVTRGVALPFYPLFTT